MWWAADRSWVILACKPDLPSDPEPESKLPDHQPRFVSSGQLTEARFTQHLPLRGGGPRGHPCADEIEGFGDPRRVWLPGDDRGGYCTDTEPATWIEACQRLVRERKWG